MPSQPSIGGNPIDPLRRCEAKTTRGSLCKQPAAVGSRFCPYHDPKLKVRTKWDAARAADALREQGGGA